MPVTELSDVDVRAISLVKKGANRQRIFLYKCDDDLFSEEDLVALPHGPLIKNSDKEDWSVFYAVVAEPGKLENPGMTGKLKDRWASDEEIAKAAWKFMKNGALINKMHASLESVGELVENAVALQDLTVNGQTIKKGSWYIGVEPTDDAKKDIEKGELQGVSIEGAGVRVEVAKDELAKEAVACLNCGSVTNWYGPEGERPAFCSSCGKELPAGKLWAWFQKQLEEDGSLVKTHADEAGKQAGPLRHLIAFYMKKPHPFKACVRDNRKRFGPRTEAICAGLKDVALGTHRWRAQFQGKPGAVAKDDDATARDAAVRAAEATWESHSLTDTDAILALQAVSWHEGRNEGRMKSVVKKLWEAAGLSPEDLDAELAKGDDEGTDDNHEEEHVGLTKEETERIERLEKAVGDLGPKLDGLGTKLEELGKSEEEKEPTLKEVQEQLGKLDEGLEKAFSSIEKLAEGDTSTEDEAGGKSKVQKQDPLAGLLST